MFKGKGCLACRNSGYKGRIGIYELLLMDADISELVLNQAPGYKIREQARKNGMTTLLEDGIIKIERGDTTISEVYETFRYHKISFMINALYVGGNKTGIPEISDSNIHLDYVQNGMIALKCSTKW